MIARPFSPVKRCPELGLTTLEHALILPLFLGLILGAVNAGSLIQGYTALREGVRSALRCVATTDGACHAAAGAPATPLFHWHRLTINPTYWVDRYDLRGHGYWLERPTTRYDEARVLEAAHYTVPASDYTAKRWSYRGVRPAAYNVRESRGAYVRGASATSPTFVFKNARSEPYPSLSTVTDRTVNSGAPRAAVHASFNPPLESYPCFSSTELDEGPDAAHLPSLTPCSTTRIPAAVFVRGAARGHGHGEVRLSIEGRHIADSDFGGQQFDVQSGGWISRNFVPRGVPAGYVDPAIGGAAEFSLYADAIELSPGETITVTVSAAAGPGRWTGSDLEYKVTEVRIVPAITRSVAADVPCPNEIPRSRYLAGDIECAVPYPAQALELPRVDTTTNLDASPPIVLAGMVSPAHAADTLRSRVGSPDDYIATPGALHPVHRTSRCPDNSGVPFPANDAGRVTDPGAAEVCPIDDQLLNRYNAPATITGWSEAVISLPSSARFAWTKADCADEGTLPPALLDFPKRIAVTTHSDFFPAAPSTPLDERFRCAEFHLHHLVFDEPAHGGTVELPNESLFLGIHPDREIGCLEDALKVDAVHHGGLDPRAHFTSSRRFIDTVGFDVEPTLPCGVFRTEAGSPTERTLLTTAGPLPEGTIPPECITAPCTAEFASFAPGGAPPTVLNDLEQAGEYWGFKEIKSIYPRARWGCSGPECAAITIEPGAAAITGSGSITVPLHFPFNRSVTLTYADTMVREARLANGG